MHSSRDIDPITSTNIKVAKTLLTAERLDALPSLLKVKLSSMVAAMEQNGHTWPHDKTGRWLGFIQGVLYSHDAMDIDDERDRTRDMFHHAYQQTGLAIPDSIDVERDSSDD